MGGMSVLTGTAPRHSLNTLKGLPAGVACVTNAPAGQQAPTLKTIVKRTVPVVPAACSHQASSDQLSPSFLTVGIYCRYLSKGRQPLLRGGHSRHHMQAAEAVRGLEQGALDRDGESAAEAGATEDG